MSDNPFDVIADFFDAMSRSSGFEDFLWFLSLALLGGAMGLMMRKR